jgi:hypothetical protein
MPVSIFKHSTVLFRAMAALVLSLLPACSKTITVATSQSVQQIPDKLAAYTECHPGDRDCNMCAYNVEKQFNAAFGQKKTYQTEKHNWSFDWSRMPVPARKSVSYFFDAPIKAGNKKPDWIAYHIQGFVRTNDPVVKYAGSHSNAPGEQGALFFIAQKTGKNSLKAVAASNIRHPSGVAVLGDFLLVGEKNNLRIFDIKKSSAPQNNLFKMPKKDPGHKGINPPGGGVAAVKLKDGTFLFAVSTPGGNKPHKRVNRFYKLKGKLDGKLKRKFIGEQQYDGPLKYQYSENLTLITECGTGRIYALNTGTNKALSATGYWRLSRLDTVNKKPALKTVAIYKTPQNLNSCHIRSAATAWVSPKGQIEFYCHEYLNNPDFGDKDTWNFRRIYKP